jgi:hypothetical protein
MREDDITSLLLFLFLGFFGLLCILGFILVKPGDKELPRPYNFIQTRLGKIIVLIGLIFVTIISFLAALGVIK